MTSIWSTLCAVFCGVWYFTCFTLPILFTILQQIHCNIKLRHCRHFSWQSYPFSSLVTAFIHQHQGDEISCLPTKWPHNFCLVFCMHHNKSGGYFVLISDQRGGKSEPMHSQEKKLCFLGFSFIQNIPCKLFVNILLFWYPQLYLKWTSIVVIQQLSQH